MSEPDDRPACIGRAWSVSPRCGCPGCSEIRRARRRALYAGTADNPSEQAWAALEDMIARRYSRRAIASATGVEANTLGIVLAQRDRGYRRRLGPGIARAIVNWGPPQVGTIGAVGATRRMRALACACWPPSSMDGRGFAVVTAERILNGEKTRIRVRVAAAIDLIWQERATMAGGDWAVAERARRYGWAPAYAWRGLDIDDPAVTLPDYPHADRSTAAARKALRRTAVRAARKAARNGAAGGGTPVGGPDATSGSPVGARVSTS